MAENPRITKARREFSNLLSGKVKHTIDWNQRWEEAVEKDETGLQCERLVEEARELLTPMKR
jgi:hypothetical protein